MSVARVEFRESRREPARKRVIAGSPRRCDAESVGRKDVAEPGEGQDMHVLPGLALRCFARVKGEPVTDRTDVGDVCERERLIPERECDDVVPAREILGADERNAVGREDAPYFRHEMIEAL